MLRSTTIVLLSLLVFALTSHAEPMADSPATLDAKPVRVAMFKNGIGLVQLVATLPDEGGACRITPLPRATAGSFWLNWSANREISDIRARWIDSFEMVDVTSTGQTLEANIGSQASLLIDESWIEGTIVKVTRPQFNPLERRNIQIYQPQLVIFKEDTGRQRVIPVGSIKQVMFTGDASWQVSQEKREQAIDFFSDAVKPGNDAAKQALAVNYLAEGIAWAPSYMVDISEDGKARFVGKAIVVNDLVDLEGAEVDLIAGYPHIDFADKPSMFSLDSLANLLAIYSSGGGRSEPMSRRAGVMVQSNEMYFDAMAPDMSGLANIDMQAVAGSQAEDLYYYHLKDVTLAKDERGYFPLLSLEVPYEHIYTWDIADTLNPNRYNPYQQQQQETPQVVWHSLKLTNTGDQPWTTAPAMTVQHGQVLGQDMIKFTAPTAETKLRITQAVSIAADHNEYEIDRQRNAQIYGSRQHDLVTVRGELSLINRKAEAVTVEITKLITGTVEETQGDPKIEKLAHGLRAVNPQARLTWKIEVQPGNDNVQTLTYTYKVYVPN